MSKIDPNLVSEFRRDIVSGEWILVSSVRQLRPHMLSKKPEKRKLSSKKDCPFEDPQKSGNGAPLFWYPKPGTNPEDLKNWFVQVIPNKYPILLKGKSCPKQNSHGPYEKMSALGFHEVIITRDHTKDLKKMSLEEVGLVLKTYKERYLTLEKEGCVDYIQIFHNHGELAGASVAHPHSQLVALPIVPPDVSRSVNGGINFFKKNKKCVHCTMLDWELKEKERIIFRNKYFVAIVPYAARVPYEVRIFPITHHSDFEEIPESKIPHLSECLQISLKKLGKVLKNPDYNFFIHTASAKVKNVPYYHWHIEIYPRTYRWAGLELGTGIEVVAVSPEMAAQQLKSA